MQRSAAVSFAVCLAVFTSCYAQATQTAAPAPPAAAVSAVTPVTPRPTAPVTPDATGRYMVADGTDVNLRFSQAITSKTAADGDPVILELVDDLKVGNIVVAKAGTKAYGEVTNAKRAGMMGKAGELNLRLDYLKTPDGKVKLRGTKGKEGDSRVTSTVVLTVLFGPIGLIKHGKEVEIKEGAPLHAFTSDDIALAPVPAS